MIDTDRQNSAAISDPFSPCFTTRCVCCNQRRELWRIKQEWLELEWGAQFTRKWSQLPWDALYDTTP
jgi:hypothetical protein